MRLAAYAGVSVSLAAGVILRAFHERPNFYSATVYLAQSNACRLILLNVLLLFVGAFMVGLQRLLYGPLRPIEIEQLWDKAWYAITETALAMTVFRDEVGGWFFVMFVSLLAGKVWSWISEGRVEILEQQPPANPRLFHARLVISLFLSELFDVLMLRYCVSTLMEQPRPGMMVMFAFEFAVLMITSTSTTARYALSLQETVIIKQQTRAKIEERRQEIRAAREEAQRQATSEGTGDAAESATANLAREEDIDENEIDVPGWQEKGRWVLFLDLTTDFLKLLVYVCFFVILLLFHGIPIHILRDVLLTTRSFLKRILDFIRYRNATRDMNERYPDATAEELSRDGTCIICREEMRAWQQPEQRPDAAPEARRPARTPTDERQRAKKLPCGHILHFGCLRSWLERQQVCPTCRSPVLVTQNRHNPGRGLPGVVNGPGGENHGHQHGPNAQNGNRGEQPQNDVRARAWALGPLRLTFAAGNQQQVRNALQRARDPNTERDQRLSDFLGAIRQRQTDVSSTSQMEQIANIERQIVQEIHSLGAAQEQLATVRALQGELERLRGLHPNPGLHQNLPQPQFPHLPLGAGHQPHYPAAYPQPAGIPHGFPAMAFPNPMFNQFPAQPQVFGSTAQQTALDSGHTNLPQGMSIPQGWSLIPLQRVGAESSMPAAAPQPGMTSEAEGIPSVVPQVQAGGRNTVDPSHSANAGQSAATLQSGSGNSASTPSALGREPAPLANGPAPQATSLVPDPNLAGPTTTQERQPEGHGPSSIPDWSNAGSATSTELHRPAPLPPTAGANHGEHGANGETHEAEGADLFTSEANGHASGSKPTGRAPTVEDAEEDEL